MSAKEMARRIVEMGIVGMGTFPTHVKLSVLLRERRVEVFAPQWRGV